MKRRVICDCDNTMGMPGKPVDDGQALLYLFGRPDIDVLGVTTVFGNSTGEQTYGATKRLLECIGQALPLHRGANEAGEMQTDASRFLVETAAAHPGEITVLALGPLNNLRAAAEQDPQFFDHLEEIVIMGGYTGALDAPGWERVGELNLSSDPIAAQRVLRASCPVTLMTAQICLQVPFNLRQLPIIEQYDRSKTYAMLRDYLFWRVAEGLGPSEYLWDLLPAVYVSFGSLFDEHPMRVSTALSDLASGTIVHSEADDGAVVNLPTRILNVDQFYAILHDAWAREAVNRR